jgi:hypothetical protein
VRLTAPAVAGANDPIGLARFLIFQKDSALVRRYRHRTVEARGATRKMMIVALARELALICFTAGDSVSPPATGIVRLPANRVGVFQSGNLGFYLEIVDGLLVIVPALAGDRRRQRSPARRLTPCRSGAIIQCGIELLADRPGADCARHAAGNGGTRRMVGWSSAARPGKHVGSTRCRAAVVGGGLRHAAAAPNRTK